MNINMRQLRSNHLPCSGSAATSIYIRQTLARVRGPEVCAGDITPTRAHNELNFQSNYDQKIRFKWKSGMELKVTNHEASLWPHVFLLNVKSCIDTCLLWLDGNHRRDVFLFKSCPNHVQCPIYWVQGRKEGRGKYE